MNKCFKINALLNYNANTNSFSVYNAKKNTPTHNFTSSLETNLSCISQVLQFLWHSVAPFSVNAMSMLQNAIFCIAVH